jgi:hypothetical protein
MTTATYIGGPTALLNVDGVRLLTDPTFDAPILCSCYDIPRVGAQTTKLAGPATVQPRPHKPQGVAGV